MGRTAKQSIAVYFGFAGLALLLLHFTPFRVIHDSERDYGELPIALIDGLVTAQNVADFLVVEPREGSILIWAAPTTLTFWLLGPSLFSLRLTAILLAGLWAVVWYWVARLASPSSRGWLVALCFVVPLPLIQLSNLSSNAMMTHLGSSLWHGAALLALAAAPTGSGARWAAMASGTACGIGLLCGYSVLPLIPGVVWVALGLRPRALIRYWAAAFLPLLLLGWTRMSFYALDDISVSAAVGSLGLSTRLLAYGAGIYTAAERSSREIVPTFSSAGVLYPLLFLAVVLVACLRRRRPVDWTPNTIRMTQGLVISVAGFLGALALTGYEIGITWGHGLRYLIPLAAPLTVLYLAASTLLARRGLLAAAALVVCNLGAYAWHIHRFETADFLHVVRGYRGRFLLDVAQDRPLLRLDVPEGRREHYAIWMGLADARHRGLDLREAQLAARRWSKETMAQYWRGVGLAGSDDRRCLERGSCVPAAVPASALVNAWQGVGAGFSCRGWRRRIERVPESVRDAFIWGLGRTNHHDCEDWPDEQAARRGAEAGIIADLAIAGREAALIALRQRQRLPRYEPEWH